MRECGWQEVKLKLKLMVMLRDEWVLGNGRVREVVAQRNATQRKRAEMESGCEDDAMCGPQSWHPMADV